MPVWPAQSSKMPKVAADPPIHNAPKLHGFPISHELVIKGGALCVEMGFYADISWESRCNIKINSRKSNIHCKVIIGRNPIEANANTVAIQLPGNPVAYSGKCFTPYYEFL